MSLPNYKAAIDAVRARVAAAMRPLAEVLTSHPNIEELPDLNRHAVYNNRAFRCRTNPKRIVAVKVCVNEHFVVQLKQDKPIAYLSINATTMGQAREGEADMLIPLAMKLMAEMLAESMP